MEINKELANEINGYKVEEEWNKDVATLKLHLKEKLWRDTPKKHSKWVKLLNDLARNHQTTAPVLNVNPKLIFLGAPFYDKVNEVIALDKYSVISLLHEFGHHIYGGMEVQEKVRQYSEWVFVNAYKPSLKRLVRNKDGFLVLKETIN